MRFIARALQYSKSYVHRNNHLAIHWSTVPLPHTFLSSPNVSRFYPVELYTLLALRTRSNMWNTNGSRTKNEKFTSASGTTKVDILLHIFHKRETESRKTQDSEIKGNKNKLSKNQEMYNIIPNRLYLIHNTEPPYSLIVLPTKEEKGRIRYYETRNRMPYLCHTNRVVHNPYPK